MIRAAGILFQTPDRKALFLKRSTAGDMPGMWCFPGGKIEDGETARDAAVRESQEEAGHAPSADALRELCRRIAPALPGTPPAPQMPASASQATATEAPSAAVPGAAVPAGPTVPEQVDFTTFVVETDEFTPKLDQEHVGYCWAPMDSPPEPLHPGCRVALARDTMDEQQVAQAMAAGDLVSPQRLTNSMLWNMRVTGTGLAYRHRHDEYVWRDPSLYMNAEFVARCNGLPVIVEHPEKAILDTKEYGRRNVGSIIYAYLRPEVEEVWGIARIIDTPTNDLLSKEQMSTSPSVVFKDTDGNEKLETEKGPLLVEGKPSLLDHLAICENGVWDKGGEPRGIESATLGELSMADKEKAEEMKDDTAKADAAGEKLDKMLNCIDSIADSIGSMGKRMDALEARMGKADDDEEEEKKDDDEEEEKKDDSKKSDDDDEEEEKKDDSKKSDDDEEEVCDDDDDEDGREEGEDKTKPKQVVADKKRRDSKRKDSRRKDDDDDDDDDDDKKADSAFARISRLESLIRSPSDDDFRALADAQERADAVFSAFGDSAPRPLAGETTLAYRLRMARKLQSHSGTWGKTNLNVLAKADSEAFGTVEKAIYDDAMSAAKKPKDLKGNALRAIVRSDDTGRRITTFVGNRSFVSGIKPKVRRVTTINTRFDNAR